MTKLHIHNITGCIVSCCDTLLFINYADEILFVIFMTDYKYDEYTFEIQNIPTNIEKIYKFTCQKNSIIKKDNNEYSLIGPHIRKKNRNNVKILSYNTNPYDKTHSMEKTQFTLSTDYDKILDEYATDMIKLHKL